MLKKIILPPTFNNLRINKRIFANCSNLEYIQIPEHIKEINITNFINCVSLKEVVVPNDAELFYFNNDFPFAKLLYMNHPDSPLVNLPKFPTFIQRGKHLTFKDLHKKCWNIN